MHSILKDGSYILYGKKIIPNPQADDIYNLTNRTIKFKNNRSSQTGINFPFMQDGYIYSGLKNISANSTGTIDIACNGNILVFATTTAFTFSVTGGTILGTSASINSRYNTIVVIESDDMLITVA